MRIPPTREEKQLRVLMIVSMIAYFVGGLAFIILPTQILRLSNTVSEWAVPAWPTVPLSVEKFWLALAFSMMMTIAALAFIAQHNVRSNKGYVVPILISKCASSLSGLALFVFSAKYFAYLLIVLVDGSIFWLTLIFYLRGERAWFEAQTAYLRRKPPKPPSTGPTVVAVARGQDKFALLDEVLEQSGFYEVLQKRLEESGKSKAEFSIAIKPNFMYMHAKKDISTYVDPELVEALVDKIADRGFTNIALVESQSTLGNYYDNRDVVSVAEHIGYSQDKNYRIIDLTLEKEAYDYGGRLGKHWVGPTWRDADLRISFAKNKTHVFCHYTLTLKNVYGTLPMQDKLREYHTRREYDWPTIETLKHFPVHFGIIDAIYSGDGHFGVIVDPTPNPTNTMIAGENLIAVDWVGAKKMGLDPDNPNVGRFLPLAVEAFGKPQITWVGDKSVYDPWENVSEVFIQSLDMIEEAYAFSDWWFSVLTAMDPHFPFNKRAWPALALRAIIAPFKRIFYRYDYLGPGIAVRLGRRIPEDEREPVEES